MEEIYNLLSFYYQKNPDSLLPLLLAAAASRSKLEVKPVRHVQSWDRRDKGDDETRARTALFYINFQDADLYEWIKNDTEINRLLQQGKSNGAEALVTKVVFDSQTNRLVWCMTTILKYEDNFVPRFHYKQSRVIHHSYNEREEEFLRNYAGIRLALAFNSYDKQLLQKNFVALANFIMEKASIQPKRNRLQVVNALCALLDYQGKGSVYVPFAGTGLLPAMINAGPRMHADAGDIEYESAVGRLTNYGAGGCNENFIDHNSYAWCGNLNPDYIACTYLGNTTQSHAGHAMWFCLSKCLENPQWRGKLAATIQSQYFFESPGDYWGKALERNWVDTVVALSIGEVCILFNGSRKTEENAFFNFIDCTNAINEGQDVKDILKNKNSRQKVTVKDAMAPGFLKGLIARGGCTIDGYENISLSDLLRPLTKECNFSTGNEEYRILVSSDGAESAVCELYEPSYHLKKGSLIIPSAGRPIPYLYEHEGDAYLSDGYAFEIINSEDKDWIMQELQEDYVFSQLHPYGCNSLTPPHFEIDDFLNIILRRKTTEDPVDKDILSSGYVVPCNNQFIYEIKKVLGRGRFGITYEALETEVLTRKVRRVALKELFVTGASKRLVDGRVRLSKISEYKAAFDNEAALMAKLAKPGNHIMSAEQPFECHKTGTSYYVMKSFERGSLLNMIKKNQVPSDANVVSNIIEPLCQAIKAIHDTGHLHLDINPGNILFDDKGFATLTGFGFTRHYGGKGNADRRNTPTSKSFFLAPEQRGNMAKFEKGADIYSLSATLYYMYSHDYADSIPAADTYCEIRLRNALDKVSPNIQNAIIKGLHESPHDRQSSIEEFLDMIRNGEGVQRIYDIPDPGIYGSNLDLNPRCIYLIKRTDTTKAVENLFSSLDKEEKDLMNFHIIDLSNRNETRMRTSQLYKNFKDGDFIVRRFPAEMGSKDPKFKIGHLQGRKTEVHDSLMTQKHLLEEEIWTKITTLFLTSIVVEEEKVRFKDMLKPLLTALLDKRYVQPSDMEDKIANFAKNLNNRGWHDQKQEVRNFIAGFYYVVDEFLKFPTLEKSDRMMQKFMESGSTVSDYGVRIFHSEEIRGRERYFIMKFQMPDGGETSAQTKGYLDDSFYILLLMNPRKHISRDKIRKDTDLFYQMIAINATVNNVDLETGDFDKIFNEIKRFCEDAHYYTNHTNIRSAFEKCGIEKEQCNLFILQDSIAGEKWVDILENQIEFDSAFDTLYKHNQEIIPNLINLHNIRGDFNNNGQLYTTWQ